MKQPNAHKSNRQWFCCWSSISAKFLSSHTHAHTHARCLFARMCQCARIECCVISAQTFVLCIIGMCIYAVPFDIIQRWVCIFPSYIDIISLLWSNANCKLLCWNELRFNRKFIRINTLTPMWVVIVWLHGVSVCLNVPVQSSIFC